jgi:RNA polymerase sigma factor (sigma-70 family)
MTYLSNDSVLDLVDRVSTGCADSRNRLILNYYPAGFHIAHRVNNYTNIMDVSDLAASAHYGLIKAVDSGTYDRTKAVFTTWVYTCMERQVYTDMHRFSRITRVDAVSSQLATNIRQFRDDFREKHGRVATEDEVCAAFGVTRRKLRTMTLVPTRCSIDVIDTMVDAKLETPSVGPDVIQLEYMHAAISNLRPRDRHIICSYYGVQGRSRMTMSQIAQELGIVRQGVGQHVARIEKHLQASMKAIKQALE